MSGESHRVLQVVDLTCPSPQHGRKCQAFEAGAKKMPAAEPESGRAGEFTLGHPGTVVVRAFVEKEPQRQGEAWQSQGRAGAPLGSHWLLLRLWLQTLG